MATYFVYEIRWGREYSHRATIHLADCIHCNNGRGRKNSQDVTDSLSKWLGPFQTYQQALDAAKQTGKEAKRCRICAPYR
jgi:hypothetical protein